MILSARICTRNGDIKNKSKGVRYTASPGVGGA
jgi:hypothetical protein